jgi:septal ring factor EnvC (AmiA/AmiB activator)
MPVRKQYKTKKVSEPQEKTVNAPILSINLNTIITTILGAVIIFLVTSLIKSVGDHGTTLTQLSVEVPNIKEKVTEVKSEVAEVKKSVGEVHTEVTAAKEKMITREELNAKQQKTDDALKEIRGEQQKVREDIKTAPHP